jgi:hypothetical protein
MNAPMAMTDAARSLNDNGEGGDNMDGHGRGVTRAGTGYYRQLNAPTAATDVASSLNAPTAMTEGAMPLTDDGGQG